MTEALHAQGENLLVIEVDNGEKSHIYPQVADFTFYGGLYRGVNLILVPEVHFDLDFYGAPGLKVTPVIKGKDAEIKLESWVKNADENYTVRYQIKDADGNVVAESWRPAEQHQSFSSFRMHICGRVWKIHIFTHVQQNWYAAMKRSMRLLYVLVSVNFMSTKKKDFS